MTEVTENRFALIGHAEDRTGRLDVVQLLRLTDLGGWVRYEDGREGPLDLDRLISRDAEPCRLTQAKDALTEFWSGALNATDKAVESVTADLTRIDTEGRYDIPATTAALEDRWIEQRQDYWRTIITQMRKHPILAPEPA